MKLRTGGKTKKKIAAIAAVFSVLLGVLLIRVAWIQVVRGNEYTKMAYEQQNSGRTIPAMRGTITDAEGNVLAVSVAARQVSVNQDLIKTTGENKKDETLDEYRKRIAEGLASFLGLNSGEVLEKIQTEGKYKEIARKVDVETAQELSAWLKEQKIKGVYITNDVKRNYPNGSLACHVLGFTGRDDQGVVCGVEVALDSFLAGTAGRIIAAVDTKGNELPFDEETRIEPVNGYNVKLNINANIQAIAEEVLEKTTEKWDVKEGCAAIVMDPWTGKILAMASNPAFDLNNPYAMPGRLDIEPEDMAELDLPNWTGHRSSDVKLLSSSVWRNKCLTDTYEPGSTFKAFTASIGLENDVVNPETEVCDDDLVMGDWTIGCAYEGGHGWETFADAVKNSCNGAFARLALDIGKETFYDGLRSFGLYEKTGVLLSGEANSIMHKNPSDTDRAVAGFGQRLQVTPMQMIRGYCAIANGGFLLTPNIVDEITDENGNVVMRYDREVERQAISEYTSKTVLTLLENVVNQGGGYRAYVPGYRVAGKTGTSETIDTLRTDRFVASFCGIAPVDDPKIVVLVVVDHPNNSLAKPAGGRMAAPAVGEIIERTLEYMGVERRFTEADEVSLTSAARVPGMVGRSVAYGIMMLDERRLKYEIVGDYIEGNEGSTIVYRQSVPEDTICNSNTTIILHVGQQPEEDSIPLVKVPDLVGKRMEEAYVQLEEMKLGILCREMGVIGEQDIPAGTMVKEGTVIQLLTEDMVAAGKTFYWQRTLP